MIKNFAPVTLLVSFGGGGKCSLGFCPADRPLSSRDHDRTAPPPLTVRTPMLLRVIPVWILPPNRMPTTAKKAATAPRRRRRPKLLPPALRCSVPFRLGPKTESQDRESNGGPSPHPAAGSRARFQAGSHQPLPLVRITTTQACGPAWGLRNPSGSVRGRPELP